MILLSVGSQKFPFDRLIREVDGLIEKGIIKESVFGQIGCAGYVPHNFHYQNYLSQKEFREYIESCTLVITHGGTGVITSAVKAGKKVIAVPRLACYGEHVDDHQKELIERFEQQELIIGCMDVSELGQCVEKIKDTMMNSFPSNTWRYIRDLDELLKTEEQKKKR